MDYPKFIVLNQKEKSISIQRVKKSLCACVITYYYLLIGPNLNSNSIVFDKTFFAIIWGYFPYLSLEMMRDGKCSKISNSFLFSVLK